MSPNRAAVSPKTTIPIIVLTGGGSGGHITPLLSLAHELKLRNPNCQVIYIGLKGEKLEGLQKRYDAFDKVRYVRAGKFRRYHGESFLAHLADVRTLLLNARDFFRVIGGVVAAWRQLRKIKPNVIFSKGGFGSVPVGLAARILKIPIVTHDSDAVPGLANRIVGRWALVRTSGIPTRYSKYPAETVQHVGIPVDERIQPITVKAQKSFKKQIGVPEDQPVILVAGGGLGSARVNELVVKIVPELLADTPDMHVVHITGQQHKDKVKEKYSSLPSSSGQRVAVIDFTDEFYKYSGAADLIITRAGATTLAEFALMAKPCIVIPSPFLSSGHQLMNSKELARLGAIEVVSENIEAEKLLKIIKDLMQNEQRRDALAQKLGSTARPDAAKKLSEILLKVAARER